MEAGLKSTAPFFSINNINLSNSPNSILIQLQQLQYRSLVDSGAEISLISQKVFNNLKYPVPLRRKRVQLQAANGSSLNVLGSVDLDFKLGGLKLTHSFTVVSNLNRNIILGRDFLVNHGVRLYYDLAKLRVGKTYVPL